MADLDGSAEHPFPKLSDDPAKIKLKTYTFVGLDNVRVAEKTPARKRN